MEIPSVHEPPGDVGGLQRGARGRRMGGEVVGYGNEDMPASLPLPHSPNCLRPEHHPLGAAKAEGAELVPTASGRHLTLRHHRPDQPLEKTVDSIVVDPAYYRDKVVLGIDIDHIEAVAVVHESSPWRTRPLFTVSIEEIVDEAVGRLQTSRRERHVHPALRQQLAVAPLAPVKREIAEASHIIGIDE